MKRILFGLMLCLLVPALLFAGIFLLSTLADTPIESDAYLIAFLVGFIVHIILCLRAAVVMLPNSSPLAQSALGTVLGLGFSLLVWFNLIVATCALQGQCL